MAPRSTSKKLSVRDDTPGVLDRHDNETGSDPSALPRRRPPCSESIRRLFVLIHSYFVLRQRRKGVVKGPLAKLDHFDLTILDDLPYVHKDQAETSVLFELIAERYERRSVLITANQPFSGRSDVFPDPSMTVAAIDRLVHHRTIFELNVESYRRRSTNARHASSPPPGKAPRAPT